MRALTSTLLMNLAKPQKVTTALATWGCWNGW